MCRATYTRGHVASPPTAVAYIRSEKHRVRPRCRRINDLCESCHRAASFRTHQPSRDQLLNRNFPRIISYMVTANELPRSISSIHSTIDRDSSDQARIFVRSPSLHILVYTGIQLNKCTIDKIKNKDWLEFQKTQIFSTVRWVLERLSQITRGSFLDYLTAYALGYDGGCVKSKW